MAVVVPVFNEGREIEHSLAEMVSSFGEAYPGRAAIVAVDDGSGDDSAAFMRGVAERVEPVHLLRHEVNSGYGAACRTGARWALDHGYDYVAFIDSDLTNPPADLLKAGKLARAGADYIKGSRYLPGGRMEDVPWRRQVFSRSGYRVGSLLFGTAKMDVTNGFRAARTDLYCSWPLVETGFSIIMEEMYWALKASVSIESFPTVLGSRGNDRRDSAFEYTPKVIGEYLRYPLRRVRERLR